MTSTTVDRPAPAPATVVWLVDRWRRTDHTVLLTRVLAVALAVAVAALLAATPLWLPETVYGRPSAYNPSPVWVTASDPQRWFGLVATCAGLLGVAAVALAPRAPWVAWGAAVVPFVLLPLYGTVLASSWLALAAVAVVVATRRPWPAILPWASAGALAVVWHVGSWDALFPSGPGGSAGGTDGLLAGLGLAAYPTGAVVLAAWLGHVLRASAARTRDAESVAHDAVVTTASVTERARLARELHDVVAHHVSLVAVRAESAPFSVPDLDPRAAATFAHIADDARTALAELRHVLTVLRRDDDAPLAPLPSGDVAALVAAARTAGQSVTVEGTWPQTDAGVGHVLHRAVQEGLTNARRHAPGRPCGCRCTGTPGSPASG
ncbi:sensor histidine kinase [Cellulomonas phragmiteti]|uniref:histidine kinase n=1 Tax=Cellulomonas phragmiteti TaxID=478780 RepID=A0ABQ4DQC7_9CELL|nr:histidine kinase [Cellulomonas phragmiteti]GIG41548.1 hypothetical protein Cph01nite_33100 [Cellulomonas phragmiteti]